MAVWAGWFDQGVHNQSQIPIGDDDAIAECAAELEAMIVQHDATGTQTVDQAASITQNKGVYKKKKGLPVRVAAMQTDWQKDMQPNQLLTETESNATNAENQAKTLEEKVRT